MLLQIPVAVAGRTRGTVEAGALELPCAEAVAGARVRRQGERLRQRLDVVAGEQYSSAEEEPRG